LVWWPNFFNDNFFNNPSRCLHYATFRPHYYLHLFLWRVPSTLSYKMIIFIMLFIFSTFNNPLSIQGRIYYTLPSLVQPIICVLPSHPRKYSRNRSSKLPVFPGTPLLASLPSQLRRWRSRVESSFPFSVQYNDCNSNPKAPNSANVAG
jgi:hypothetical protein